MIAQAKHLLVDNETICKEMLADIESGKSTFEEAAAEYSLCPSGMEGGDLGNFSPGMMVKEFDQVVFSAEINKIYGPVKTQFGYHLLVVTSLKK